MGVGARGVRGAVGKKGALENQGVVEKVESVVRGVREVKGGKADLGAWDEAVMAEMVDRVGVVEMGPG